jgi:Mrp family chromosome partitioning ATPase
MMDVVAGAASLEDAVASRGAVDVMGRGEAAETPSYVWKSDAMQRFLDDLRSRYDRVVLHLPPILSEQDAVNAAAMADGFVVAIAADRTRREVVERALDSLGPARVKVLGAVLTEREQVIPELVYKRI